MIQEVTNFTCRNGDSACYFCGRPKGQYHENNCRWMTDMKVRNLVNETNLAYEAKAAADRRFEKANSEYSELQAEWKLLSNDCAVLLDQYLANNKRIREIRKHHKIIEAMFEALL